MRRAPARRPLAALATLAMAATIGVTAISMSAAQAAAGNLSLGAGADGSSKASGTSYGNVKDGSLSTYWSPSGSTGSISIKWGSATTVSSASIVETSGASGRIGAWQLINADSGSVLKTGSGAGRHQLQLDVAEEAHVRDHQRVVHAAGRGVRDVRRGHRRPRRRRPRRPRRARRPPRPRRPPRRRPARGRRPRAPKKVSSTINVSGTLDGGYVRYYGISSGDQNESQPPIFQLSDGATLQERHHRHRCRRRRALHRAPARWRTCGGRTWARTPPR